METFQIDNILKRALAIDVIRVVDFGGPQEVCGRFMLETEHWG